MRAAQRQCRAIDFRAADHHHVRRCAPSASRQRRRGHRALRLPAGCRVTTILVRPGNGFFGSESQVLRPITTGLPMVMA